MLLTNDLLHWADFVKEIFQIVVKAVNINSITAKDIRLMKAFKEISNVKDERISPSY